tara:strand:- start:147 stop:407 length:261 start_codon:yes stop_codon:yes gene_type:complete
MKYEFYRVEYNERYPNKNNPSWSTLEGWDDDSLEETIKDLESSTGANTVLGNRAKYRIVKVTVEEVSESLQDAYMEIKQTKGKENE